MKTFNFTDEFNEKELKKRYKDLVKKFHPDLNKNYLNKEQNIKEINKSYSRLLKFLKNKMKLNKNQNNILKLDTTSFTDEIFGIKKRISISHFSKN